MSKIFTSKNYQNLINKKVGTNTPFSKLFKDLRCQIFPLWKGLRLKMDQTTTIGALWSLYLFLKFDRRIANERSAIGTVQWLLFPTFLLSFAILRSNFRKRIGDL